MFDARVTRDQAAEARREAIRLKDGDATAEGLRLTRFTPPLDTGPARTITGPTTLRAVVHRDMNCECDNCDDEGNCEQCRCSDYEAAEPLFWSRLTGVASVVETGYEMWDMFGPYQERVASTAFDASLLAHPDVAFLANHTGLSMARTANNTLTLTSTPLGLGIEAWVNKSRHDVSDLVAAIQEGSINQMSFAAYLEQGEWNDDCTEFTMTQLDLHCGDVSAVNFGANPYTSIAARSTRFVDEMARLPVGAARIAMRQLETRLGAAPRVKGLDQPSLGRAVSLVHSALLASADD